MIEYLDDVHRLEESKKMPYITFAERYGMEKGIERGIEQGMDIVAKKMLLEGVEIAFIAKMTELSPAHIQKLQQTAEPIQ